MEKNKKEAFRLSLLAFLIVAFVPDLVLYLIGAFTALDLNPAHWSVFQNEAFRLAFISGEIVYIIWLLIATASPVNLSKWYDEY